MIRIVKLDRRFSATKQYNMQWAIEPKYKHIINDLLKLRECAHDILGPGPWVHRYLHSKHKLIPIPNNWYYDSSSDWSRLYFRNKDDLDKVITYFWLAQNEYN